MSSVYKVNHMSVPTSVLSNIQNTVDVIHVTNIRYKKCKDNVKKLYLFTDVTIHTLVT